VRPLRLALWSVVGGLAVGIEWLSYDGGSVGLAAADLAVGVTFIGCGVVIWDRRPRERVGWLFMATGLTWFLGTLAESDLAVLSSVGAALLYLHRGPLVQLVLAYPTGRIQSRLDRIVVAAAYLDGLVVALGQNDAVTVALVVAVVAAAAIGVRGRSVDERQARSLATACAALIAATLALGSVGRLAGAARLSDTSLLLLYEAALLVVALSLAIGILGDRSRSAEVADLVVELGTGPRSETLRGALARAFGDPSFEVGYRVGDGYVDDEGRPVTLPDGGGRLVTLVERDGEPVAALVHDAALARDPGLADAVAAAIRLSASNARLQAELRGEVRELGASRRRLIEAGDAQRRRLERRLHQAAELHLEDMHRALERGRGAATPEVAAALAVVERELEQAVVEVHELARGIHPRTLTEHGLGPALTELATTAPTPVAVEAPDGRFPATVEVAAYFVCAEALTNVGKYARAEHASIEVRRRAGRLRVEISDDGVGGADPTRGTGLRGLADRVDAVGGRLLVTSPIAGGTSVVAEIPLEQPG
jgi:signal transduction histidine kinase